MNHGKNRVARCLLRALWLTCLGVFATAAHAQSCPAPSPPEKIIRISGNFVVDSADTFLAVVDRARAKGANAVIFSDAKFNSWALDNSVGTRWFSEMRRFYDGVKARDMKFFFETITIGYCSTMLSSARDLTTGYPIRGQPLRAVNGMLEAVSTATVPNGGFEGSTDNQPDGWDIQDAIGTRTFIDTNVKRSGSASFRADARDGAMSRVMTRFAIKPWHHYRMRFWMKAENLSANYVAPIVLDDNNNKVELSSQFLNLPRANPDDRDYLPRPQNFTRDWTEVMVTFNSRDATSLRFALSVFGGTGGSVWWDDVSIEDVPTLNWLQRSDLPRSATRADATVLTLGADMAEPVDPKLGNIGFAGRYGAHHAPTMPAVLNGAKIRDGDIVLLSGYHALPAAEGQVACSWNSPAMFARMRTVHEKLQQTFQPDGYLLNYDEVRTGGFEPADLAYANSGAAFAASIARAYRDLDEIAPNARHYFWSDMVDPNHNAIDNYYQINNTLAGAWETLNPNRVTILNWWSGETLDTKATKSLLFFSQRKFRQVIGGFYDEDVADNRRRWKAAAGNTPNIVGSMYTTWADDYSQIEAFGDLWWR
jgi:hypothetical protein